MLKGGTFFKAVTFKMIAYAVLSNLSILLMYAKIHSIASPPQKKQNHFQAQNYKLKQHLQ